MCRMLGKSHWLRKSHLLSIEKRFAGCCFCRMWRMVSRYCRCGSVSVGGGVPHQSSSQRCSNDVESGSLEESEWQLIICKRDASRWSQTRNLHAGLLIFSSTCDYLQLWVYHGRKVKAMLDNGTIVGITLEPLRLQKGFLTKAIMQDCLSQNSFMPQHCVNSLKSEVLSRAQGAVQNVVARSCLGLCVVQRLVYKGGRRNECVSQFVKQKSITGSHLRLAQLLKVLVDAQCAVFILE